MPKPVQPILVHFPIALLVTSLEADAAFFFTRVESLRHAGWWMLAAAALGGALAVLAGLLDMSRAELRDDVHVRVHRHMWVGIALFVVLCGLAAWRWTFFDDPAAPLTALYLDAAVLAVALAAFQGWLGGELVYSHGVSVERNSSSTGAPEARPDDPPAGGHSHTHSH